MTEEERKALIVKCEHVARDVIDECREQGETDLRTVRSRISTAFAKFNGELQLSGWQPDIDVITGRRND